MQLVLLKPVSVSSMREEARGKSRPSRNRKSRYYAYGAKLSSCQNIVSFPFDSFLNNNRKISAVYTVVFKKGQ